MIGSIYSYCKNQWFISVFGICLILIIVMCIYSYMTNKEGSWSNKQFFEYKIDIPRSVDKDTVAVVGSKPASVDSKGETECRRVLSKIFNKPFLKCRPDFLRNPVTGNSFNLEIDCFEESMKLGVEYQGRQHYEYIEFFHKNKEHFLNQKYRDNMKKTMCKENKITLIEVPYNIKVINIESYLRDELRKNGII